MAVINGRANTRDRWDMRVLQIYAIMHAFPKRVTELLCVCQLTKSAFLATE